MSSKISQKMLHEINFKLLVNIIVYFSKLFLFKIGENKIL